MYHRLRLRFQNHHEQDALTHLEQAGVRPQLAMKAIDAGLRPTTLLRLMIRHGSRCGSVMEELLNELDAAHRTAVS